MLSDIYCDKFLTKFLTRQLSNYSYYRTDRIGLLVENLLFHFLEVKYSIEENFLS